MITLIRLTSRRGGPDYEISFDYEDPLNGEASIPAGVELSEPLYYWGLPKPGNWSWLWGAVQLWAQQNDYNRPEAEDAPAFKPPREGFLDA